MNKYLLALDISQDQKPDWKEVTLVEFQRAEQYAGFRNKGGGPTATAGFIGRGVIGRVLYEPAPDMQGGADVS